MQKTNIYKVLISNTYPGEVQFPTGVTVESLKALDFYHSGNSLVMYGSTGTGKTMLSICIGMEACKKGIPVKFFRTSALINQLSEAQERGTLSQLHRKMDKAEILILDEFGYVPYNRTGSPLLFDYLSEIHEKKVIILNTNLEWKINCHFLWKSTCRLHELSMHALHSVIVSFSLC